MILRPARPAHNGPRAATTTSDAPGAGMLLPKMRSGVVGPFQSVEKEDWLRAQPASCRRYNGPARCLYPFSTNCSTPNCPDGVFAMAITACEARNAPNSRSGGAGRAVRSDLGAHPAFRSSPAARAACPTRRPDEELKIGRARDGAARRWPKTVVPMAGAAESATRRLGRLARWAQARADRQFSLQPGGSPGYDGGLRFDEWAMSVGALASPPAWD